MAGAGMEEIQTPIQALAVAVRIVGGQAAMARLLGVSQPSVWGWLHKQKVLPSEHVLTVESATQITRYDLRPDIYGSTPLEPVPNRSANCEVAE